MNKEQMKEQIIERIFDNPEAWQMVKNTYGKVTVDEPILNWDCAINQILSIYQQHEAQALKEQMEGVIGVIETEQSDYGRENDGYKALEYVKQALKAELEGENG